MKTLEERLARDNRRLWWLVFSVWVSTLILCAIILSSCHVALTPTEYGTAYDSTLGWPPGNTEMVGPGVTMSHNKDAAYGSLNNTIAAMERLAPLAASYAGQGQANQQALDLIEANRPPAARPSPTPRPTASFPALDMQPLSIPAIQPPAASSTVEIRDR